MDVPHGGLRGDGFFSDLVSSPVFGDRYHDLLDSRFDDQYTQQVILVSSGSQASEFVSLGRDAGSLCDRLVVVLLWNESLDLPRESWRRQVSDGSVLDAAGNVPKFYSRLGWLDDATIQSPSKRAIALLISEVAGCLDRSVWLARSLVRSARRQGFRGEHVWWQIAN